MTSKPIKRKYVFNVYPYTDPLEKQIITKDIYIWWLVSIKNTNKNQIIFDWVCNICWLMRNNMFQNYKVSSFDYKQRGWRNYLKNIFDYILDKTKYQIVKTPLNILNWKEAIINNYIKEQKYKYPYVEVLLVNANKTDHVVISQENFENELKYNWQKIIYVKWFKTENWKIKEVPIDVIINTNIIPSDINNLQTWKMINNQLVLITDWDILIWPNSSFYNWILMTKKNLLIMPSNRPFRLYWWLIVAWKVLNYKRQNLYNINYEDFSKNFTTLKKNFTLVRLKYPVTMLFDKRFMNSKLYSYVIQLTK